MLCTLVLFVRRIHYNTSGKHSFRRPGMRTIETSVRDVVLNWLGLVREVVKRFVLFFNTVKTTNIVNTFIEHGFFSFQNAHAVLFAYRNRRQVESPTILGTVLSSRNEVVRSD